MSTQENVTLSDEIQVSGDGASFVGALFTAGAMDSAEIVYFLDKPWKWQTEYEAWEAAGKPTDYSEPGWDAFTEAVGK